jgi:hypothetical protein
MSGSGLKHGRQARQSQDAKRLRKPAGVKRSGWEASPEHQCCSSLRGYAVGERNLMGGALVSSFASDLGGSAFGRTLKESLSP